MSTPVQNPGQSSGVAASSPVVPKKISSKVKNVFGSGTSGSSGLATHPSQQMQALDTLDQVLSEVEASGSQLQPKPQQQPEPQPTSPASQKPSASPPSQMNQVAPPPTTNQNPQDLLQKAQVSQASRAAAESLQPVASVAPQAIAQATDTLNPGYAAGSAKEALDAGVSPDYTQADSEAALGDVSHVEAERTPEISPEVEAYLTKVQDHTNQVPEEIVIADDGKEISTKPYIAQPVIVLPLTEEEEKQGQNKKTTFSIRWLVEWSRKIMKIFSGKVVYKESST